MFKVSNAISSISNRAFTHYKTKIKFTTTIRKTINNTTSRNLSSRGRRKRPSTGTIAKSMDDETQAIQHKKTQFQITDMLETAATGLFVPRNDKGEEVTMGEYLQFATLSPWVPCPDAVARRALDIGGASADDIHYELGSGDGRVNFFAIDLYNVRKSVGVDIDPMLIQQSNERIMKRHPAPENIRFIRADLSEENNAATAAIWEQIGEECTILTMYFVEDALEKLKPLLEKHLLSKQCKILTIGYAIDGWEPKWAENVLGLTIHMYDMKNLDELYNRSTHFRDISEEDAGDIELNELSRKALAQENKDSDGSNPFSKQPKETSFVSDRNPWDDDVDFGPDEFPHDDDHGVIQTVRK